MNLNAQNPENEDVHAIKCNAALRKLANFCNSYKPEEIDELNSSLLTTVISENYSYYTNNTKERLLDYFEALEEVLPALYDLHEHIRSLNSHEIKHASYEEQTAYRGVFASLKSDN